MRQGFLERESSALERSGVCRWLVHCEGGRRTRAGEDRAMATSGTRTLVVTAGFLAVAAFFLSTEHRAHAFGILPLLLILACPLMHMFGHGGHGQQEPRSRSFRSPDATLQDPHAGHGSTQDDDR